MRKYLLAATAASLLSTAAFAADLPIAPPPAYAPPPVDFGGWYLRGDIGMTNQNLKSLTNSDPALPAAGFQAVGMGFDSSALYDLGVGYQFNNWFRGDVIGQYRSRANFHGAEYPSTFVGANNYYGSKSEWLVMANAYVDLGTWWCITPFIGAGVGGSYNKISGFRDDGFTTAGGVSVNSETFAQDAGKWNLAWAVHAGLAYKVTPGFTVELAYSYMNLGSATTGHNYGIDPAVPPGQYPWTMNNITSNDIKLGVRWSLEPTPMYAPHPLITKG